MSRQAPTEADLLCSVDGCTRPWSQNFGRRLCPLHGQDPPPDHPPRRPVPVPTREPAGWWTEPNETGPDA